MAAQVFSDFAENGVVVRRLVVRDGFPVHRAGSGVRVRMLRQHLSVPALRVGIVLAHEGYSSESALESGEKVVVGQIALDARLLLAIVVENDDARCPDGVEAVEPGRMLLYVGFYGKEMLFNEIGGLLVFV